MNKSILKLTNISSNEKLILLLVNDWYPLISEFNLTSADIATELGLKRKEVLDCIGSLEERDYIETEVGYRSRITRLTPRLKSLIVK